MRRIALLILAAFLIAGAAGCSTVQPVAVSMGLSEVPNPFDPQKPAGVYETYYDIFPDVPLPRDMKVDKDKTYQSPNDLPGTGFIMLTGNVDVNSLLTAQAMTLTKDGWTVTGFFRYQYGAVTAEKGDRVCVVSVGESLTVSYMMIWVTPKMNGFSAPLSGYAQATEESSAPKTDAANSDGVKETDENGVTVSTVPQSGETSGGVQESQLTR